MIGVGVGWSVLPQDRGGGSHGVMGVVVSSLHGLNRSMEVGMQRTSTAGLRWGGGQKKSTCVSAGPTHARRPRMGRTRKHATAAQISRERGEEAASIDRPPCDFPPVNQLNPSDDPLDSTPNRRTAHRLNPIGGLQEQQPSAFDTNNEQPPPSLRLLRDRQRTNTPTHTASHTTAATDATAAAASTAPYFIPSNPWATSS